MISEILPAGAVLYKTPTDSKTEEFVFECPGCKKTHFFRSKGGRNQTVWKWNRDLVKPTVEESIIVNPDTESQCHFFIHGGRIHFQKDSFHELAGTVVDMVEIR